MSQNILGESLRRLREKSGYTQQQIANVLNIDRSTYSYYELGKTSPDISTLLTLAGIFSVSLEELLGQEPSLPAFHDSNARIRRKESANHSHIYDLRKDELQLIAYFRAADTTTKAKIMETVHRLMFGEKSES